METTNNIFTKILGKDLSDKFNIIYNENDIEIRDQMMDEFVNVSKEHGNERLAKFIESLSAVYHMADLTKNAFILPLSALNRKFNMYKIYTNNTRFTRATEDMFSVFFKSGFEAPRFVGSCIDDICKMYSYKPVYKTDMTSIVSFAQEQYNISNGFIVLLSRIVRTVPLDESISSTKMIWYLSLLLKNLDLWTRPLIAKRMNDKIVPSINNLFNIFIMIEERLEKDRKLRLNSKV